MATKEKDKGLLLSILVVISLLFIAMPICAELTDSDLTKIENMILQSEKHMTERMDQIEKHMTERMDQIEKRMTERMDQIEKRTIERMDVVEGRIREEMRYNFTIVWVVMAVGFAFLSILIGVPQVITTIQGWRERRVEGREIAELKERLSRVEMTLKAKT